ncbi:MAG: MerR family transcriptional regulator [Actinomycetota bacterium]
MPARNYQSIGEVLVGLKTEYPDITISKIRFLESEGLIAPERTPSGYRKFYDPDVDRLRMILKLQRDEYLPLKVIKDRLQQQDAGDEAGGDMPPVEIEEDGGSDLAEPVTGLQMSVDEMSTATGLEPERIKELESFGLICSHGPEGAVYYDGDDYLVLSIVKDFLQYGVEPRHLRMYRQFAERESGFFESIVVPVLRQRNPEARKQAVGTLQDLSRASRKLKAALLRINLKEYLSG